MSQREIFSGQGAQGIRIGAGQCQRFRLGGQRVVSFQGTRVGGVVVVDEQVGHQFVPLPGAGLSFPRFHPFPAEQGKQTVQLPVEGLRVGEEMRIFLFQQGHPHGNVRPEPQAGRRAHARQQGFRGVQVADLLAFRFDEDRLVRGEATQGVPDAGLEQLLGGLRPVRVGAQHRAHVRGEVLQVEHLRAAFRQGLEEAALADAGGAAHHPELVAFRQGRQFGDDMAAIGLVAAFELAGIPADGAQYGGEGAAAVAAAPAVDQGPVVAGAVGQHRFQVAGDVAGDQGGAGFLRLEGGNLLVQGADARPFLVVQHRQVDGAGNVVLGEFGGRSGVDDLVEGKGFLDTDAAFPASRRFGLDATHACLSRMMRALSRCHSRSFSVALLSCSFLPLARPISTFTRPFA